jgi:hypothetical protein
VRKFVERHEAGEIQVFMHPNCLAEAYKVISTLKEESPEVMDAEVKPEDFIRSAYATLSVVQNESTTIELGSLRLRYRNKPWGDLSSAALAIALSSQNEKIPVVILDHERHFKDIEGVNAFHLSELA